MKADAERPTRKLGFAYFADGNSLVGRNKFLFSPSARLYQQSENLASFLLESYLDDDAPLAEPAAVLVRTEASRLTDECARKRAVEVAWNHLVAVGSALDPRSVVPGLLEAIEQYYYGMGPIKDAVPWLGPALKTATSVIWANQTVIGPSTKAHNQVRRLVAAAAAWEQLALYDAQARALELGPAEFLPSGIRVVREEDREVRKAWRASALARGLAHRTLQNSRDVIWNDVSQFMEAVAAVLGGEQPSRIPLFQGTVFEQIEPQPNFWLGLSVRLHLLAHAMQFRRLGRPDSTPGISLFEPFASTSSFIGEDPETVNAAVRAMFWQREWHRGRLARRDSLSNMVVERPAMRIDDRTFAVAMTHIGDSINGFVEHSVLGYTGYGGVPVSQEAFRRFVSQPFEDRVIAYFSERGWKADHISEGGAWSGARLCHLAGQRIPGEVDVLAKHPRARMAILVECKVLALPFNATKLLNVAQKLGHVDAEGFHRKLEMKAEWLRGTPDFADVQVIPMLVVDDWAFLGSTGPNPVVDVDALPGLIDECGRHG
ncbi:hypothetical protein [Ramlibacter sp. Leaf400]|uniref:hypothetical protein n=1 Tax=Ramlibacter sp. Leaf400 TaxID=1736365 RepID=UPI00138F66F4|nr:hypothetical protein [Ramlibacter sp. Leaf400]